MIEGEWGNYLKADILAAIELAEGQQGNDGQDGHDGGPVSYTHLPSPRDISGSRMPSSA